MFYLLLEDLSLTQLYLEFVVFQLQSGVLRSEFGINFLEANVLFVHFGSPLLGIIYLNW